MFSRRELEGLALRKIEGFPLSEGEGLALSKGEELAPGFRLVSSPPPSALILKAPKSNHSRTYAKFSRKSNDSRTYAYPPGEGDTPVPFSKRSENPFVSLTRTHSTRNSFLSPTCAKTGGVPCRSEVRPLHERGAMGRRETEKPRTEGTLTLLCLGDEGYSAGLNDGFEKNGGDDETRTRDLCRDRAAF